MDENLAASLASTELRRSWARRSKPSLGRLTDFELGALAATLLSPRLPLRTPPPSFASFESPQRGGSLLSLLTAPKRRSLGELEPKAKPESWVFFRVDMCSKNLSRFGSNVGLSEAMSINKGGHLSVHQGPSMCFRLTSSFKSLQFFVPCPNEEHPSAQATLTNCGLSGGQSAGI